MKNEPLIVLLMMMSLVIGIVIGVGAGVIRTNTTWEKDCEQIGFHRYGDTVYECRKVTK